MLHQRKGLTLIELLVVVAIIGVLAAVGIPNMLTAVQRSKFNRTKGDLKGIASALGAYYVDYDRYPTDGIPHFLKNSTLTASYYEGPTVDAWGSEYIYRSDGENYTIESLGSDKDFGCKDGGTAYDCLFLHNGGLWTEE